MILEATDIRKKYDTLEVLKGVSLQVKKGEVVSLVGPSGAGKSTLLHIIGTLDKPDAGEVTIEGKEVFKQNEKSLAAFRNKSLGFIFQFHHLLPEFTALENICIPAYIGNKSKREAEEKASIVIESAKKNNIQLISYISGISVNKQNTYFKPTEVKYNNEQQIIASGINYVIFKPTWFMESLPLFVNNGRASYFGKQKTFIPFVASADYVKMVLQAYNGQIDSNKSYEVIGTTLISFQDALSRYVERHHKNIKKVSFSLILFI